MTHAPIIPERFTRTITELYEDKGIAWLARLPVELARHEQRWSMVILPPFPNLSYNYVAPARRADGTEIVFKFGVPNPELRSKIAALQCYDGHGSARMLDADAEAGVLLLERLRPGTTLAQLAATDDEAATAIAADVMRGLWRPPPAEHAFPTLATWTAGLQRLRATFDGNTGPFPARLVERAERLFVELLGSAPESVLLHGDLHHENILAAQRQPWLAIDPKGIVGDPAYEVAALLHNQLDVAPDVKRLSARRIDQLSEALGIERQRVLGWGIAQAVLSAWWTYEDHGHIGEEMIAFAEILTELKATN